MDTFQEGYQHILKNMGGVQGTVNSAEYTTKIKDAVHNAINNIDSMAEQRANVSVDYLKGWLAEPYHAGTFNINAAARGRTDLQVKVPNNNGPADFYYGSKGILSQSGQSKYYMNAEATAKAISKAKYDGMAKIVPSDQLEGVKESAGREYLRNKHSRPEQAEHYQDTKINVTDQIEKENVSSRSLSESDAKEIAKDYKKNGKIDSDDYDLNTESFVKWKDIGRQSLEAGAHAAAISAALKLAPYIAEIFKQFHKSGELDLQILLDNKGNILRGSSHAALRGAIAGGITAAIKTGKLGETIQAASPATIGIITTMAINVACYAKDLHQNKITKEQLALYCIRDSIIVSFGIAGGYVGQSTIPIPVLGAMVGNLIGSTLGAIIHDQSYQGILKVCVVSGWTMFGLVEQDYSIPEEHLYEIGFETFNQDSFTTDTFSQGNFPVESFKTNSLSFTPLRRGVVGYNVIGYK